MGVCCSKQRDREDGIRQQIAQTVVEQQKIKEEEEQEQIQFQCYSSSRKSQTFQINPTNPNEICNLVTQVGNEDVAVDVDQPKLDKIKRKKSEHHKDDANYLRKLDHILSIKSIVVEVQKEGDMKYYKISTLINYKELCYNVNLYGTLTTQLDFKYFTLKPRRFEEAHKYSRFLTFFSNDNYFNADKECTNNFNAFDKLLYVERSQQELKANMKRLQKRQSTIIHEKLAETCLINSTNQEMLEIISVVDIEQQSRFLTVLFHLLVQKYFKKLELYLVFITNATFLFEVPPQFDQPTVYRLALFYDKLDYSLKDLQNMCLKNQMELSKILYQKLALNLIDIFYQCYSNYLYRLNFTLSTIFYVSKFKMFKLQTFGRLKYLLQFGMNVDDGIKLLDEKKMRLFQKAFKKDLLALCDLLVYFKKINNLSLKQIQTQRKKFVQSIKKGEEQDEDTNYLIYIDKILSSTSDRYILEFIRMAIYANEIKQTDKTLQDTLPIIESLQKSINEYESNLELQGKDSQQQNEIQLYDNPRLESQQQKEIESEGSLEFKDDQKLLTTFQFDFNSENEEFSLNKDKFNEAQLVYKELLYQSLLFQDQFYSCYQKFQVCGKSKLEEAYVEVLYAFYTLKSMNDESWQYKLKVLSKLMNKPIEIMNQIYETSIDHFHITIIFQILTLSQRKPLPLLNEFQRSINKQLAMKMQMDKRLRSHNSSRGIIEQKKHIMVQLMYAQSYLASHNYYQAVHKIQKVIGFQLKNQHLASLFYGYSLLVSGEIQKESLQAVSAMLNLEMSQVIYDGYFPEFITLEETQDQAENGVKEKTTQKYEYLKVQNLATSNKAKLELLLGMSYFDVHDQENSLKCLKMAEILLLRSFDMYADEVVTVVLKQLQLFVLQDDIGSAFKITLSYAEKMNQYYIEGKTFKRKIISKLQFIMACIFEFNGLFLSALRYIERSNRTYTNSKCNNFIIQMHFQAKKLSLISKIKAAFQKIKNKQQLRDPTDLALFSTLNEHMAPTFLSQFYRQRFVQKSSLLLEKYGLYLIKVQQLQRLKMNQKALKILKKIVKILNKTKKDELYAILSGYVTYLNLENSKKPQQIKYLLEQIEINERYFLFPFKEFHLLKCLIYLIILYTKMNQAKSIQETNVKIQMIIDEFLESLQWKSISTKSLKNAPNKFEIFLKKGRISLLYQISAVVEIIEYYHTLKKQIFDAMFNGMQLVQLYKKIRVDFEQFMIDINSQILFQKQNCMFGYYSQIKYQNYEPSVEHKNDNKVQETVVLQSQQEKDTDTNLQKTDTSKIVFDIRSYQEILISNKQTRLSKQQLLSKTEPKNKDISFENISGKHEKQKSTNYTDQLRVKSIKKSTKLNPFESTMKKTQKYL
ncbi:unnamed protein product (macronuclear) [Paramecium tetraurelia]|uniref:Uncharacterized protein n=1 Tax=Paramecium tetraurelia TaxID=5888 RepID=A0D156_PARTE|nr:uncharacterized protein GSPATT00012297001 [Paramecium tetraurelia]CAK76773.1 unnamed protein product [Paramecium tetraurelia]|eukprot:XP_001444170.1 hypothetical protein (macronuclear) [Paramecium tetraurelia strain d4-2]